MRVNTLFKLVLSMVSSEIQMVGMVREIKSRTENNNYLLIDKKNNITGATKNFLKQTGLMPEHFSNYFFNMALFCPELKLELNGMSKNLTQMIQKKDYKKRKTLILRHKDSNSTSSNMLKMMKMNHKMMMKKKSSLANEDSSDEEDIQNNGYFSGKLKIPINIKAILNEYSQTIISRMTTVKADPIDENQRRGLEVAKAFTNTY